MRSFLVLCILIGVVYGARNECGPNQRITQSGYDCVTCENRGTTSCPLTRQSKCRCRPGYIKSNNGSCITNQKCRLIRRCIAQDPNSEYSTCGSGCRNTCFNRNRRCNENCVSGCFCKKEYLVNDKTKKCVLPENCPRR